MRPRPNIGVWRRASVLPPSSNRLISACFPIRTKVSVPWPPMSVLPSTSAPNTSR